MSENKYCCLFGCSHSPLSREARMELEATFQEILEWLVEQEGVNWFISGMVSGTADLFLTQEVMKLRKDHPQVFLDCFRKRNKATIDACTWILILGSRQANPPNPVCREAFLYARRKGKPILFVDISTQEVLRF